MTANIHSPGGAGGDPHPWEPPGAAGHTLLGTDAVGPAWKDLRDNICCWRVIGVVSLVILVIGILLATSCPHVSQSTASKETAAPKEQCPEKWSYYRNCFFFNATFNPYDLAKDFCSLYNASLLEIDDQSKLVWLKSLPDKKDYWIGLRTNGGVLQWTGGALYDNTLFQVHGSGDCAYVRNTGVFLSSCTARRRSICERRPWQ